MKVVCVFLGALVVVINGQAYVSYYGQDLHHPTLSKESNTPEEAQLYQQDNENQQNLLSKLLLKHYGFDGNEQLPPNLPKEELQHHIRKREIHYEHTQQDIHIPIIGKDGVPLDTPAVEKARQQHFLAHQIAKARLYNPHHQQNDDEEGAYTPIVTPKHPYEYVPIIGKSGVPIDTAEVQFARKQHFAAVEAVKARQYEKFLVQQPKESIEQSFVEHPEEEIPYEQYIEGQQQDFNYGYY